MCVTDGGVRVLVGLGLPSLVMGCPWRGAAGRSFPSVPSWSKEHDTPMELYVTGRSRLKLPDNREFVPEDMPIDTALRVLDVCAASRKPLVVRGNEPLLYPQLEQLLASAAKRRLPLLFETTGLMPTLARRLVSEHCRQVVLRVYRPELYGADDLAERQETVAWLRGQGVAVSLCVYVDEMSADYSFALSEELCGSGETGAREVIFRLPCREPVTGMRPFVHWYVERQLAQLQAGRVLTLDCGVKPCSFTDEDYGRFHRLGVEMGMCVPHSGVRPDGRTVHCWEMASFPGRPIQAFRSADELNGYYFEVFNGLQWQADLFEGCVGCPSRLRNHCMGVSMAAKSEAVERRYQELKAEFESEGEASSGGKERLGKLWTLARLCQMLARHADAVECLEELRAQEPQAGQVHLLLGEAYWELGRLEEGEEEYRKASRLMEQQPLLPLEELRKRLVRNGNTIRARLLQGEMEKLAAAARARQR